MLPCQLHTSSGRCLVSNEVKGDARNINDLIGNNSYILSRTVGQASSAIGLRSAKPIQAPIILILYRMLWLLASINTQPE